MQLRIIRSEGKHLLVMDTILAFGFPVIFETHDRFATLDPNNLIKYEMDTFRQNSESSLGNWKAISYALFRFSDHAKGINIPT